MSNPLEGPPTTDALTPPTGLPPVGAEVGAESRPWLARAATVGATVLGAYGIHHVLPGEASTVDSMSEHLAGVGTVSELAVVGLGAAVAGLARHGGRIKEGFSLVRRHTDSRRLDRIDDDIATQTEVVVDNKRIVQGVREGRTIRDHDAPPGSVLPKGHYRVARKANDFRDKESRLLAEVEGIERYLGQPLGTVFEKQADGSFTPTLSPEERPTVTIVDRDGVTRVIPVGKTDLHTVTGNARLAKMPGAKKDRDMVEKQKATHHHEHHKAGAVRRRALEKLIIKPEKKLGTLSGKPTLRGEAPPGGRGLRDIVAEGLDRRGGWIEPVAEQNTRLGRRVVAAKRSARTAAQVARTVARPVGRVWHYFRD